MQCNIFAFVDSQRITIQIPNTHALAVTFFKPNIFIDTNDQSNSDYPASEQYRSIVLPGGQVRQDRNCKQ
jgi:hypothetical protein